MGEGSGVLDVKPTGRPRPFTWFQVGAMALGIAVIAYMVLVAMPPIQECAKLQQAYEEGRVAEAIAGYGDLSGASQNLFGRGAP